MTPVQWRVVWLVLLPVAALAWELHVERTALEDHALRLRIDDLRTSAANVDALALSARFGSLPAYDPLVETLQSTRAAARALRADVAGNAEMKKALAALETQLEARAQAIEEIKSRRGALTTRPPPRHTARLRVSDRRGIRFAQLTPTPCGLATALGIGNLGPGHRSDLERLLHQAIEEHPARS